MRITSALIWSWFISGASIVPYRPLSLTFIIDMFIKSLNMNPDQSKTRCISALPAPTKRKYVAFFS